MAPFEQLKAWQASHRLALAIYRATEPFPATERYGLTAQLRRAAYSAGANIAEGSAKRGNREFRRFLDITIGSLAEIAYALILARDLGYLSVERFGELDRLREEASRITWGLYRSMRA